MKNIHIFGISTPVGQSFKEIFLNCSTKKNIFLYSRNGDPFIKYNLENPDESIKNRFNNKSIIISFAPIWHMAYFFKYLISLDKSIFKNIESVILLSSTSVLTKKFSANKFDKNLYNKLKSSEENIIQIANESKFNLSIIRPTLIYGAKNNYTDQNISKIGKLMKIFPIILFPKETGLRQPIHISQLAEVVYQVYDFSNNTRKKKQVKIFEVGGDITLSYLDMIYSIRENLLKTKKITFCKIIQVPNKIFYFFIFPIYFISPKIFESLLRIQVNLSGFKTCSIITNKKNLRFPVENI